MPRRNGSRCALRRICSDGGRRDLPSAIELVGPGMLQISYRGAEDLLAKIVELAAAATNDFPAFRSLYEGRK